MSPAAAVIRALCEEYGITFAELSRRSGISQPAMGRWWRGETTPTLETRRLIARAIGVPWSRLILEGEDRVARDEMVENESVVATFLASPDAADLTDEEVRQVRLSSGWLPGQRTLTIREVRLMADLIRSRLREPIDQRRVLNLPPAAMPRRPGKRRPASR